MSLEGPRGADDPTPSLLTWIDGVLTSDPTVSAHDRGFQLGDGLFETLRVHRGRPLFLRAHFERLEEGAHRIGLSLPRDLEPGVAELLAANQLGEGALRITVSRGEGGRGLAPGADDSTAVISVRPFLPDPHWYTGGIRGITASGRLNEHGSAAGLKSLSFLDYVMAAEEARRAGCEAALLRNMAGHLAEESVSNLFVVRDGVVSTPPLSSGALPGITRAVTIELLREDGAALDDENPVTPGDLAGAGEAFLTNSLRGLVPLVELDGAPVGEGRPGPVWGRGAELYAEFVEEEVSRV